MQEIVGRGVAAAALLLSLSICSCLSDESGPGCGVDDVVDAGLPDPDCTGETCDSGPVCPPPEPHGHKLGDRLVNQQFTLLDGSAFELHELCGVPAALLFNFYGW